MLYNTIALPLFDYCSLVWDNCGAGSKAYLDKLNRRAASNIEGLIVGADILKSTLGWPSELTSTQKLSKRLYSPLMS